MDISNSNEQYIPTASQMAKLLTYLQTQLYEANIIDCNIPHGIPEAVAQLRSLGSSKNWHYSIENIKPLTFKQTFSEKLQSYIVPKVVIAFEIEESLVDDKQFAFKELNAAIEITDFSNGDLIYRAHVDLSTSNRDGYYQNGPMFHLQHGGGKLKSTKIRRPRWLYPPMDLVLISELVIANFYTETWNKLRRQPRWIELIKESQMLCYLPFFKIATENIETASLLDSFWADQWDDM